MYLCAGSSQKKRALISVSDKRNLDKLAKGLAGLGFELVSTGGSAAAIQSYGVPVTKVEEITGFPEMLDGTFLKAAIVLRIIHSCLSFHLIMSIGLYIPVCTLLVQGCTNQWTLCKS